jgi:hypothetical protein
VEVVRLVSHRFVIAISVVVVSPGCAPHGEELQPSIHSAEPVDYNADSPIVEDEPDDRVPPIVAPTLPELVPTRPLASLAPLWHHLDIDGPAPRTVMAVGEAAVAINPADAAVIGISGAAVELDALAGLPNLQPMRWAGPLLLFSTSTNTSFTAVEAPAKVAWTTPDVTARSYLQLVSDRVLVASHYDTQSDFLVAWALHDGRKEWHLVGSAATQFTRVKNLWTDGTHGYLLSDRGLLVFDPVTGTTAWEASVTSPECGVATGEGFVVIEDPGGHRVLDAETGTPSARLSSMGLAKCGWLDYGFSPGVIAEGRLFAFDSDTDTGSSRLRAIDLQSQRELWHAEGFADDFVLAAADGVYVISPSERVLFALDAATGKIQAEISIGSSFDVSIEPVGGAAGPLLVVSDLYVGHWILGRVDPAPTPESYVIRGRLSPTEGLARRRLAGVRVQVGEQVVKTDKQGRFSARGATLGVIPVTQADDFYEYQESEYERSRVAIDPRKVVLEGKGTYDLGDIPAYEVWSE